ncbi:protein fuzzy homolog [Nasonia vitripennis]|uniref:Protein fuzzy homolog n=1 Tax=Nasonia vitripennis TaxID=7425 RepID=A0A7M7GE35_NASVI|nr:protein fuzzy homolog [Nasonia vitripennis]
MTAHVMCLTSSGGIPLFVRKKGEGELMTFSKMASLNGVHMFLKTHNVELINTDMPDTTVVWKEFKGCITLIAIASGTTKRVIDKFLDAVFNAMILIVGLKDLEQPRSVERLKRDLRACYSIIDRLLECLDIADRTGTKTDLVDLTDCIMCSENHLLQICLEGYMECLDSLYGCVLIHDCLAVATESWWSLDAIERKLLILAITAESNCTAKDLPIFLPNKSPNLAYRLVNVTLVNNVQVLALCGPTPDLPEIERLAIQCWRNSIETLRTSEQCYPRNFPSSISLDSAILGFLLVNYKIGKFVLSGNAQHSKNHVSGTHRLDTIRTFYHHAVETFLLPVDDNSEKEEEPNKSAHQFKGAKETYWCSEYHKCHALKETDHIFCVLYTSTVPTHTMRLITQKTLKILLADKQVCW